MRAFHGVLSASALALSVAPAAAAVYFDPNLLNTDWTVTAVTNANGAGSSFLSTEVPIGGAPGSHRVITHSLVASGPNAAIVTVHMRNGTFYDPGTQGAIASIFYAEDSINFVGGQAGDGQGSGLVLEQGGTTYLMRNPIFVMPFATFSNWTSQGVGGLAAADFHELTPGGAILASSNPDFSASGGVMQLGFWRGNSSNGNIVTECGLDNWYVDIRAVPAPGGLALLLGVPLLATRRRGR